MRREPPISDEIRRDPTRSDPPRAPALKLEALEGNPPRAADRHGPLFEALSASAARRMGDYSTPQGRSHRLGTN